MSFADAENAILALFQGAWTSTPVAWEDVAFDPMDSTYTAPFAAGEAWVELKIQMLPGLGQISTPGNSGGTGRRFRTPGLVTVTANTPNGRGKGALTGLLDAAGNIFRAQSFDTPGGGHLLFFSPYPTGAALNPKDQAWFAASVVTRFWYDFDA